MRQSETPVHYLVGTPRGRLSTLEKAFLAQPWEKARESVEVKLLAQGDELYILAKSTGRMHKERAMRQRRLKRLWKRLHELQRQKLTRDQLLLKLGAAKKDAGKAYALVDIALPKDNEDLKANGFRFSLRKDKLRQTRRREGRYLLRSNLTETDQGADRKAEESIHQGTTDRYREMYVAENDIPRTQSVGNSAI